MVHTLEKQLELISRGAVEIIQEAGLAKKLERSIKMNKPLIVIVDADAIIAQADPNDKHHLTATKISKFLANTKAQVIYPATAITESNAYIQRVLNSTASAYGTAVVFTDPNIHIAFFSIKNGSA